MPDDFTRQYERLLWSRRHRPVRPNFLLDATTRMLAELAELLDALGFQFDDKRWSDAAENMHAAIARLARPSELYEWIVARERGEPPPGPRAAAPRLEIIREPVRIACPPRKGQLSIRPLIAAAAKKLRRR